MHTNQAKSEMYSMGVNSKYLYVVFWPFDPDKNAIQGDAPEGSDTF